MNKLASAIGEKMATFFYTHTCSMREHIVMKHLKQYLDSEDAMADMADTLGISVEDLSDADCDKLHEDLISSSCSLIVRTWDNIFDIWIHYICESPEQPVGNIFWKFIRKELQARRANVNHGHLIFWCREDNGTAEGRMKLLEKIRASMHNLVTHAEAQAMLSDGTLSSIEELWDILEGLKQKLTHKHHRRCAVPVQAKGDIM